jgi:hypothetical protein
MKVIGQARSPYIGLGKSTFCDAIADNMDLIHRSAAIFQGMLGKILFLPWKIPLNCSLWADAGWTHQRRSLASSNAR